MWTTIFTSEIRTLDRLSRHLRLHRPANLAGGDDLKLVYPDEALQRAAWDEFRRSGGFGANAVDCLSFAIMRKLRIRRAWTFDRHFATAGFATSIPAS